MYEESILLFAQNISLKNVSFLVTGSTGLIGSCFIDILVSANKNQNAGIKIYALGRSEQRIKDRFGDTVIPVVQDIVCPIDNGVKYDFILHCASNADPRKYASEPVETILTNIIGTQNILNYCKEHLNTKILLTSTFEVYGDIEGNDVYSENMSGIIDQTILRNSYPESKRCCELLLRSYIDEYNVKGLIARLPSVYGPTMLKTDSKAHAQFIKNAVNGENIVLKSEGKQRRTYCYVVDAVSALLTIFEKGNVGSIYNISNENSVASIADVAKTCAEIAGTNVIFELPDSIEAKGFSRSKNCILDNSRLLSLGWKGKYTLLDGLKETVEYLKR